jgi:hypothetical protein
MTADVKLMKVVLLGSLMLKHMVGMFLRISVKFQIYMLRTLTKVAFIRYTFCGLAALILLNEAEKVDLPSLIVRQPLPPLVYLIYLCNCDEFLCIRSLSCSFRSLVKVHDK